MFNVLSICIIHIYGKTSTTNEQNATKKVKEANLFIYNYTSTHLFTVILCQTYGNEPLSMCYPVCGMMHIKEPLLLIGKSSPCGGSGFPLSLYEWSFTICLAPYNRKSVAGRGWFEVLWNLECPVGLSQREICVHFNEGNLAQFRQSAEK